MLQGPKTYNCKGRTCRLLRTCWIDADKVQHLFHTRWKSYNTVYATKETFDNSIYDSAVNNANLNLLSRGPGTKEEIEENHETDTSWEDQELGEKQDG